MNEWHFNSEYHRHSEPPMPKLMTDAEILETVRVMLETLKMVQRLMDGATTDDMPMEDAARFKAVQWAVRQAVRRAEK